jgi:hypothetical protein
MPIDGRKGLVALNGANNYPSHGKRGGERNKRFHLQSPISQNSRSIKK